jgi:hypothetical protein
MNDNRKYGSALPGALALMVMVLVPVLGASCRGNAGGGPGGSDAGGQTGDDAGSGGGSDAPFVSEVRNPAVAVSVSPATASLAPGGTQQFTATVTGTDDTAVTWSATGGTISSGGLFTAPSSAGAYVVRASSVAEPAAGATAVVNVTGGTSVVEPFFDGSRPYVRVMTPIPNVTYFAPATIRIWAHAPFQGTGNIRGYCPQVDFYLGTTMVGTARVTSDGPSDYYEVNVPNVPAGSYEIILRATCGTTNVESVPVPVTVIDLPPSTGPTRDLTSDLMLTGTMNLEIAGAPGARARITSSNGSRIRSAADWRGSLVIRHADVIGLGSMDTPGIAVTATGTGGIEISNSVFDRCGPPALGATGQATLVIRGNTFQPNILTPVNQEANYRGSHPSLTLTGDSSAMKLFQGNNVGVSFVRFERASHWMIGGDSDADGNVLIGVRAGMEINQANDVTVRGNISFHRYPFGWSEGMNLHFQNGGSALVEHNAFRGASWMIQNLSGEFRYNLLVDNINHAFFRGSAADARIHHNLLINVGYSRAFEPSGGLGMSQAAFYNNTVDAGGKQLAWYDAPFATNSSRVPSLRNNVFTGFAHDGRTNLFETGSVTAAGYNCFYNPDTTMLSRYADTNLGATDCGTDGIADPRFSQPRTVPFPIGDGDIWLRRVTVSQILALYRGIYTPAAGSPLIDAGDPADDTGGMRNTDIGAVGAGTAHPDDQFGRFSR